jgi:hypothetical protein
MMIDPKINGHDPATPIPGCSKLRSLEFGTLRARNAWRVHHDEMVGTRHGILMVAAATTIGRGATKLHCSQFNRHRMVHAGVEFL